MRKMKKIEHQIAGNILEGTLSATAWVFETLVFMGVAAVEVFFNSSYYADLPGNPFYFEKNSDSKKRPEFKEMTIRQSIRRLRNQGFVEKRNGKYVLTELGKNLANYILKRKKAISLKWDEKYRVVIFDIPEKQKKIRDWLRQELIFLKYRKLQESVFISKYPLTQDLVKEIKRLKIGNYVNYLLVDKVYRNILQ